MFMWFRKWREIQRHVAALNRLDDRLLADMGLERRRLRDQVRRGIADEPAPAAKPARSTRRSGPLPLLPFTAARCL
jgi:uncharacterized protein YjiS (DUF1127 family)